jgi:hypothetical protein
MKVMAPQGEWLKARILGGHREIAIIFMGSHAEERARSFLPELPCTMYLPNRTSPYAYTWPVHGCEIYLVDTSSSSSSFIKKFILHLFMQGASFITCISSQFNQKFTRS